MDWQSLDAKISMLESEIRPGSLYHVVSLGSPNWSKAWDLIAEIHEDFKNTRYPSAKDHQRAWEHFIAVKQEAHERRSAERDNRRHLSAEHRSSILLHLRAARLGYLTTYDVDDMKDLGRRVSEAGRMLSDRKAEMIGEHKQECFDAIAEVREQHNLWWAEHKSQAAERNRAWRAGRETNIEQNRERLSKAVDALHYYEGRASELASKIASAWNDDWAAGASERLSEIESKITDIEASISRIQSWIEEDEAKLRG